MPDGIPGRRLGLLATVAVLLFAGLGFRLYFLQVMQPDTFEELVAGNRIREIQSEAPRGRILDTQGRELAGRRESLVVTIDWVELREIGADARAEVFARLSEQLVDAGIKVKIGDLDRTYTRIVDTTLEPVPVAEDIGEELWVQLAEAGLAGVDVDRRWVRTYPYGEIAAHVLGYTGRVRDNDVAAELNLTTDRTYLAGDEIGIAGLEQSYESVLRGIPEVRRVEVDAQNRVVRTVEVLQEAVPGDDIVLALDIDVQYTAEQILRDELLAARQRAPEGDNQLPLVAEGGALVVLGVDGRVLALASYPTFDPRDFLFGISGSQWTELSERADVPLLDRAVRGNYPPGSTFKPFVAYAAQASGARDQFTTWNDEGTYTLVSCIDPDNRDAGCVKRNAGSAVLGPVQLREAMERSSDTYFYSLGETFWIEQDTYGRTVIQDWAEEFGFGMDPGIDLPVRSSGRVPTPERRIETYGEEFRWYPGDNTNIAIGQGEMLATPLQLTNAYAQIANGGVRYEPTLVSSIRMADGTVETITPAVAADVALNPEFLLPINEGMAQVVDPTLGTGRGTGTQAFAGFPLAQFRVIGKTGTAQVTRKADYSVFAAYAPYPNPEFAVAAVLEQAGFGGDAAAPAVRRMYEVLFGITPPLTAPTAEQQPFDFVGGGFLGDPSFDIDDVDVVSVFGPSGLASDESGTAPGEVDS